MVVGHRTGFNVFPLSGFYHFGLVVSDFDQALDELSSNLGLEFSYGVAAKLINLYMKGMFCNVFQYDNPSVKTIHPPIDRELLKMLYIKNVAGEKKFWKYYENKGWSNFTMDEYQKVINKIKTIITEDGLWTIEKYWKGYQG